MGAYSFGTDFSTGFSDRVQLGRIGQIQQSNAVVMHVQIDGDKVGAYDLRWRGVALADFDGLSGSNLRQQFVLQREADNSFSIPSFGTKITRSAGADGPNIREKIIHYRVLMEPIGTNVFFLAPWARSVSGAYRMLSADSAAAVYNLDIQHPITRYEATSDISAPSPTELRAAQPDYPAELTAVYLRLPDLDPRIPKLASQIAASASNHYDKAVRVESYLKTHFGY